MCGIIGYVGRNNCMPIIFDMLKRLEYRGYDSAGISVISDSNLYLMKDKGTVDALRSVVEFVDCSIGIGHTRWATCGAPLKHNAHPFLDCKKELALAHNGIIENYRELKDGLMREGHVFSSETDSEVIVHLIEKYYTGSNLIEAVRTALGQVRGSYAIVVLDRRNKKIVGARHESPLVLGIGKNEIFLSSDIPGFLRHTNKVVYLNDNEMVEISHGGYSVYDFSGHTLQKEVKEIQWTIEDAEKGGFEHYMLKEIYEIPRAVQDTLRSRVDASILEIDFNDFERILLIGCGTSYHAALYGKYLFENLLKVPTHAEISSEVRNSTLAMSDTLAFFITQSGETADTLAAARNLRRLGATTCAITNVVGSSITRETDAVFYTHAGPEISVAATKTFVSQITALYMLAASVGEVRGEISASVKTDLRNALRVLPSELQKVLDNAEPVKNVSRELAKYENAFYIGRGYNYPIALEGALKLKEISYIHAEGYPAGELKHGPLALLCEKVPVVAIATYDELYPKMIGNIAEVKARNSPVILFSTENHPEANELADFVVEIPENHQIITPAITVTALQLMAYYVAKERNCPIDKPRNLAKSVTVE
ncbi:MAG: glutamine--fructose-6-phosphate transaminase (isomerizing) [Thermoplasmata archaeon]|nr:glutamine--fructose-6-phosphate transaminase (isomerizing) [Thermoplasmata archaeon]